MRFDIITIFPEFFTGPFDYGILKRARAAGLVEIATHDLRSFTHDRHRTVDDRPFGGGEGMVLKAQPIYDAVQSLRIAPKAERQRQKETVILLSAQGQTFTQSMAQELAAAVIVDTVVRLLPGALGNPDSSRFESFGAEDVADDAISADGLPRSTYGAGGLLDYPHYTRPADFMGVPIPEALAGGNHEAIRRWRRRMALKKTLENRPDLLEKIEISEEDREILAELRGYGDLGGI